jgi:hypothetical protein
MAAFHQAAMMVLCSEAGTNLQIARFLIAGNEESAKKIKQTVQSKYNFQY